MRDLNINKTYNHDKYDSAIAKTPCLRSVLLV